MIRMKQDRLCLEMTQKQMADLLKVDHTLISHIEAGRKAPSPILEEMYKLKVIPLLSEVCDE